MIFVPPSRTVYIASDVSVCEADMDIDSHDEIMLNNAI